MSRNLIAILRGISPDESETITAALIGAGITRLEVPLNSPKAIESITKMVNKFGSCAQIGAGTVVSKNEVSRVRDAGGSFIVSPNCNKSVIKLTKALSMDSYPGVFTPTECFRALSWGADGLKLFPAFLLGTSGVKALRAVLPSETNLLAVGGVDVDNINDWFACGINGFGVGTALYKPGQSVSVIAKNAREFVKAYDHVF